jgi:hypothetical protein
MHPKEVFHFKHSSINTILLYLNEFTELNGSTRYRKIRNFEENLYVLEIMMNYFTSTQAKYFLEIVTKLLKVGIKQRPNKNSKEHFKTQQINSLDNYQNNFLVYSLAPVKDIIMILLLIKMLEEIHKEIIHLDQEIIEDY